MPTRCLVTSALGRPRGFIKAAVRAGLKSLGSTSDAACAREKSAACHSGLGSSGGVFLGERIAGNFSEVGFAKADDVNLVVSWREHHGMQATTNQPQHLVAWFAVVPTKVLLNQGACPFQFIDPVKRQTAFGEVL